MLWDASLGLSTDPESNLLFNGDEMNQPHQRDSVLHEVKRFGWLTLPLGKCNLWGESHSNEHLCHSILVSCRSDFFWFRGKFLNSIECENPWSHFLLVWLVSLASWFHWRSVTKIKQKRCWRSEQVSAECVWMWLLLSLCVCVRAYVCVCVCVCVCVFRSSKNQTNQKRTPNTNALK